MTKYVKDASGKFAGSIGEGKGKVPTPTPIPAKPKLVKPKAAKAKATVASHEALLARMDLFALNITTSMDAAANGAGRGTETGRLLGSWRHGVVSELLTLRSAFIRQHKRIEELEAELVNPLDRPRVIRGFSSYHAEGVQGVSAGETVDPDLLRKIGAGFLAIADEVEKDLTVRALEYEKKNRIKPSAR